MTQWVVFMTTFQISEWLLMILWQCVINENRYITCIGNMTNYAAQIMKPGASNESQNGLVNGMIPLNNMPYSRSFLSLNITIKANTYLVIYSAQNISRNGKSTLSFKPWIHFRDGIANCLTRWARWCECQWHTHKLHMAWVNQYCNALVTENGIICISAGLLSTSDPTILLKCSLLLHQQFRDWHMGGVRCVLQSGYVMNCYQLGMYFQSNC